MNLLLVTTLLHLIVMKQVHQAKMLVLKLSVVHQQMLQYAGMKPQMLGSLQMMVQLILHLVLQQHLLVQQMALTKAQQIFTTQMLEQMLEQP